MSAKVPSKSGSKRPKKASKRQEAEPAKEKGTATKLGALDAAAKVLAETGHELNVQELIAAMAAKEYWTSPTGGTPASTLYAALQREIQRKGAQSRFRKTGRGHFGLAENR